MSYLLNLIKFSETNYLLILVIAITFVVGIVVRYTRQVIYAFIAMAIIMYIMVTFSIIPYWLLVLAIFIFVGLYWYGRVALRV